LNGEARPQAGPARFTLAAAAASLLVVSALHQRHDARGRAALESFFSRFSLDVRRPELAATARVENTADLGRQAAVRAALADVTGVTPLGKLTPEERELWLRSVREMPEEVAAARELGLEAIAARPAWAFHAMALAALVVADEWREPEAARKTERWLAPLRLAAAWAPGIPGPFTAWGAAALNHWTLLSEAERQEAAPVLRRALGDEAFRRSALPAMSRLFGVKESLAFLPPTPEALADARQALAATAGFEELALLDGRWSEAERAERARLAGGIAGLLAAGRGEKAAAAAAEFLRRHPVELFDDAEGRAQARTVLEAIGDGRPGSWNADPRGALVRYFLANPSRPGKGGGLARAASGLAGVPDGTRALVLLLSGDEFGWKRVVAQSDTKGASEWTPFYLEVSRRALAGGDGEAAGEALSKVSRFDLGQCDALLVRRGVARALSRGDELAALAKVWPAAFPATLDVSAWPANGAGKLAACLDPERGKEARLVMRVRAEGPALASWGWDGGREGTVRVEAGESELAFPLAGLRGLRTFSLGPVAGAPVRPLSARIDAGAATPGG
jgi:hypothetical protein